MGGVCDFNTSSYMDGHHHSKRSKTSDSFSSESAVTTRRSSSSSSKVTTMDDLPDTLLVEIFCRIHCYKFVSRCKCMSKRWKTVISAPYFIPRFLRIQRVHKQMPVKDTLISYKGEDILLDRMSSSTTARPLSPLFRKLETEYGLKEEPVVVGTYNDLVLCCASLDYQRDYYVCNPYTTQSVALPPPPRVHEMVAVGFICDVPYYYSTKKEDEDDDDEGYGIRLNDGFRYRVLRLVIPRSQVVGHKLKVEIYASETGEWTKSIVSTSSVYGKYFGSLGFSRSITYNGMLYWNGSAEDDYSGSFLIGLDPFKITTTSISASTGDDIYKCRIIRFEGGLQEACIGCSGAAGGCLRMWWFTRVDSKLCLRVWDLNEEDDQVGRLAIHGGGDVKIDLEKTVKVYALDGRESLPPGSSLLLGSNLSNEDILYLHVNKNIIEYNLGTKEWSKITERRNVRDLSYMPIVIPWCPTPVPKLAVAKHSQ